MASYADAIRSAARRFIDEARRAGASTVTIHAGELVRELHLNHRVPAVCSALASKVFAQQNKIEMVRREGPPSGQSTTTRFTYRLIDTDSSAEAVSSPFMSLRGAGKQVFHELGGGEAFLKREREEFGAK